MATDELRRRLFGRLALTALAAWCPARGQASRSDQRALLAASWQAGGHYFIGVVGWDPGPDSGAAESHTGELRVISRFEVPTRAHGLTLLPDGRILAVARRPGDWLLGWRPGAASAQWHWASPGTVFNGHAVLAPGPGGVPRVFVTQTDTETGAGQIGVLDARTLIAHAAWSTHGCDPHDLQWHDGRLWVANGGIATQPETGRVKRGLERMDSSLVGLQASTGALLGQWRLADRRLSLRHLAAQRGLLGVALQAEHDDVAQRAVAPLLAIFDGDGLRLPATPGSEPTGGYGGDIAAWGDGFVVSATRADRVHAWSETLGWRAGWPASQAVALTASKADLWIGASGNALLIAGATETVSSHRWALQLDNHWVLLDKGEIADFGLRTIESKSPR